MPTLAFNGTDVVYSHFDGRVYVCGAQLLRAVTAESDERSSHKSVVDRMKGWSRQVQADFRQVGRAELAAHPALEAESLDQVPKRSSWVCGRVAAAWVCVHADDESARDACAAFLGADGADDSEEVDADADEAPAEAEHKGAAAVAGPAGRVRLTGAALVLQLLQLPVPSLKRRAGEFLASLCSSRVKEHRSVFDSLYVRFFTGRAPNLQSSALGAESKQPLLRARERSDRLSSFASVLFGRSREPVAATSPSHASTPTSALSFALSQPQTPDESKAESQQSPLADAYASPAAAAAAEAAAPAAVAQGEEEMDLFAEPDEIAAPRGAAAALAPPEAASSVSQLLAGAASIVVR